MWGLFRLMDLWSREKGRGKLLFWQRMGLTRACDNENVLCNHSAVNVL